MFLVFAWLLTASSCLVFYRIGLYVLLGLVLALTIWSVSLCNPMPWPRDVRCSWLNVLVGGTWRCLIRTFMVRFMNWRSLIVCLRPLSWWVQLLVVSSWLIVTLRVCVSRLLMTSLLVDIVCGVGNLI